MLDDIIGFMGEDEFREFGLPYFKELYNVNVSVKFLHNDAPCAVSSPFLPEMGVNLFNMGFDVTLNHLKQVTQNNVTLLGNIPPRDVLAAGTPEQVYNTTVELINSLKDKTRIIMPCGGGMPPEVSTENIKAFIRGVKKN
jgi:uroporphyrinogen decarboxylase